MVAITFNQPEWLITYQPANTPTLLVLADQSKSMQTNDVIMGEGAITREEQITPLLSAEAWEAGDDLVFVHSEPGLATERNALRLGFRLAYTKVTMTRPATGA